MERWWNGNLPARGIWSDRVLATHTTSYKKKVEGDELAGLVIDPKGGERLFGLYADQWIEHRLVKGKPLTPATRQGYKALIRRHLRPPSAKRSSDRSRRSVSASGTLRSPPSLRIRRRSRTAYSGPF